MTHRAAVDRRGRAGARPAASVRPERQSPAWARYVAAVVDEVRPQRGGVGRGDDHPPDRVRAVVERRAGGGRGAGGRLRGHGGRARPALPTGRAAGVGRALRGDGPAGVGRRGRGPRPAHRLRDHRDDTGPAARRCRDRRRRLGPAPLARRQHGLRRAASHLRARGRPGSVPCATPTWPTSPTIADPVDRRRARHVVTEEARVQAMVARVRRRRRRDAQASSSSPATAPSATTSRCRRPCSTALVDDLVARPGVHGARAHRCRLRRLGRGALRPRPPCHRLPS